jgi:hypothetical protein
MSGDSPALRPNALLSAQSFTHFPWANGLPLSNGCMVAKLRAWLDEISAELISSIERSKLLVSWPILSIIWLAELNWYPQALALNLDDFQPEIAFKHNQHMEIFAKWTSNLATLRNPEVWTQYRPVDITASFEILLRHILLDQLVDCVGYPPVRAICGGTTLSATKLKLPHKLKTVCDAFLSLCHL